MKDVTEPGLVKIELTPRELYVITMTMDSDMLHNRNIPYEEFAEVEMALCKLTDKYYKPGEDI